VGVGKKVSPAEAGGLWKEWFAVRGLYPERPDELLNGAQCLGTWVARQDEAVASVTLWDTQSLTSFEMVRLGFWAQLTTILMSIWNGYKLPTKGGVTMQTRSLIGVYANGKGSKELFEGLMHDMHEICHKDGMQALLVPMDISSTRQFALPYWRTFTTDLVTVAKRFGLSKSGKIVEIDEPEAEGDDDLGEAEGDEDGAQDANAMEAKQDPIGYIRGFLDPRYMCL